MSEEKNWRAFEMQKAKLRMKHDRNLPEDCHGCRTGLRWKASELKEILLFVKKDKSRIIHMSDICRVVDRPAAGIMSKLGNLGLCYREGLSRGILFAPMDANPYFSKGKWNQLKPAFQDALLDCGWIEFTDKRRVVAPDWWEDKRFIYDLNRGR